MTRVMVQNLFPRGRVMLVVVVIISWVAVLVIPDHSIAAFFPRFACCLYHRYEVIQGESFDFIVGRFHAADSVRILRVADD